MSVIYIALIKFVLELNKLSGGSVLTTNKIIEIIMKVINKWFRQDI